MARTYKIYLVSPTDPHGGPLIIDADDVALDSSGGEQAKAAFNFFKISPDENVENISVAWIPFDMVKAIIS